MTIFRIHAYEITPQRTKQTKSAPVGGSLPSAADFVNSLNALYSSSGLDRQSVVNFRVSGARANRQHDVRDLIMGFTFGSSQKAKSCAVQIATRLSDWMDDRSPASLLMLTGSEHGTKRRMTMWALPQEEAFQFRASRGNARIKLLKDIFSRSSRLRKAATFEGLEAKTDFWNGKVIDLQSSKIGTTANYWTEGFLDCRWALAGKAGTQLLATHLRSAYESADEQKDKDQIYNAMVAVRTSPTQSWSMTKFASQFLTGEAKRLFEQSVPTELRNLTFKFERGEFESKLNFRVFRLEDDVFVSAPFGTIGKSVTIKDGSQRILKCQGPVVDEMVRARRHA